MRRIVKAVPAFGWVALVLAVIGSAFLQGLLTSTAGLIWTGHAVHGRETGGILYYTYRGQSFSYDVPGSDRSGPVTVYIDPTDPSSYTAYDGAAARISEAGSVLGPYTAAVVVMVGGIWRRRRINRRLREAINAHEDFGWGLDPAIVARMLEENRRPATRPGVRRKPHGERS